MSITKTQSAEVKVTLYAADSSADVFIYSPIGEFGDMPGVTVRDITAALRRVGSAKTINVRINSSGGDCFEGIAISNVLKQSGKRITVSIDGLAASAASVIAMAGKPIRMPKSALMMIHNTSTIAMGGADEMQRQCDVLAKLDQQLAQIYADRTGRSVEDVRAMMTAETWMTGEEALDAGFCDEIIPDMAVAACAISPEFKYRNVPERLRNGGSKSSNRHASKGDFATDALAEIEALKRKDIDRFEQRCRDIESAAKNSPTCGDVEALRVDLCLVNARGHRNKGDSAAAEKELSEAQRIVTGGPQESTSARQGRIERTRAAYRDIDERDGRFAVCGHELGHALGVTLYGGGAEFVDGVVVNRDRSGAVRYRRSPSNHKGNDRIAVAGIAGCRVLGHTPSGFTDDLKQIMGTGYEAHPSEIYELSEPDCVQELRQEVERTFTSYEPFLRNLARRLYCDGELSGDQFRESWKQWGE